jgi:hypothetical protein
VKVSAAIAKGVSRRSRGASRRSKGYILTVAVNRGALLICARDLVERSRTCCKLRRKKGRESASQVPQTRRAAP